MFCRWGEAPDRFDSLLDTGVRYAAIEYRKRFSWAAAAAAGCCSLPVLCSRPGEIA